MGVSEGVELVELDDDPEYEVECVPVTLRVTEGEGDWERLAVIDSDADEEKEAHMVPETKPDELTDTLPDEVES